MNGRIVGLTGRRDTTAPAGQRDPAWGELIRSFACDGGTRRPPPACGERSRSDIKGRAASRSRGAVHRRGRELEAHHAHLGQGRQALPSERRSLFVTRLGLDARRVAGAPRVARRTTSSFSGLGTGSNAAGRHRAHRVQERGPCSVVSSRVGLLVCNTPGSWSSSTATPTTFCGGHWRRSSRTTKRTLSGQTGRYRWCAWCSIVKAIGCAYSTTALGTCCLGPASYGPQILGVETTSALRRFLSIVAGS